MGPENSKSYQLIKNTLQRNKVPMMTLTPDNFSQHIPHVNRADGDGAVVDITAGVLYADRALKTAQVQHTYNWIRCGNNVHNTTVADALFP